MSESATPPQAGPEPEAAAERQSTPFLVLQFFIFPMAIVAVCVTVFVVFGLIAHEGKTARGFLAEVRSGGANQRWQAAFELSKLLQAQPDSAQRDPQLVADAVALFDESANDDPRVRRYLALALGRMGDRRAVPTLLKVLGGENGDGETVIYAIWALGSIADPAATPELARLAASDDRDVRKAAVHSLGVLPGDDAAAALRAALRDSADDVRWNAALALGRRGDAAAAPALLQMLDRAALGRAEGVTPDQVETVLVEAAGAAAHLGDPSLRKAIEALRDADPSLKVRGAAARALEASAR